jgi:Lar family restriction alleviation protein
MTVENDAMADTATPELLSCPFCGWEKPRVRDFARVVVWCAQCGANVPDVRCGSEEGAIAAWNRRATLEGR